jgi:hypothetical protein
VQAGRKLVERHGAQPRRGQLDRERQPVDAPADVGDEPLVEHEPGRGGRRAVGEQRDGGGRVQRADGRQRLPADRQRLPARGEDAQAGAAGEQAIGEPRRRHDDVLAVVQDDQRVPGGQRVEEARLRVGGHGAAVGERGGAEPERAEHRGGERVGVTERGQLDEPRRDVRAGGHLQREARLARAAGPDERHEPVAGQQLLGAPQIVVAADEARAGRRQVTAGTARRGRWGIAAQDREVRGLQLGRRHGAELGSSAARACS